MSTTIAATVGRQHTHRDRGRERVRLFEQTRKRYERNDFIELWKYLCIRTLLNRKFISIHKRGADVSEKIGTVLEMLAPKMIFENYYENGNWSNENLWRCLQSEWMLCTKYVCWFNEKMQAHTSYIYIWYITYNHRQTTKQMIRNKMKWRKSYINANQKQSSMFKACGIILVSYCVYMCAFVCV